MITLFYIFLRLKAIDEKDFHSYSREYKNVFRFKSSAFSSEQLTLYVYSNKFFPILKEEFYMDWFWGIKVMMHL